MDHEVCRKIISNRLIFGFLLLFFSLLNVYMYRWTRTSLVQIITCCLFGAKPLSGPMLAFCELDSWDQTKLKCKKMGQFWFNKMNLKIPSAKERSFCFGLNYDNLSEWELVHWSLKIYDIKNKLNAQLGDHGWKKWTQHQWTRLIRKLYFQFNLVVRWTYQLWQTTLPNLECRKIH